MKRGRKPKPTNLRVLEGNPGKRRLPEAEPQPEGRPAKPAHLVDEASIEWDRILPELERLGLATSLDRAALAAYCQAWARWIEAEGHVKRYGAVISAPAKDGQAPYPMQNPWLAVANKALEHMRQFLVEFGMTPASRVRVEGDVPLVPANARTGTDDNRRSPAAPPSTAARRRSPDRFFTRGPGTSPAAGVDRGGEGGDPLDGPR